MAVKDSSFKRAGKSNWKIFERKLARELRGKRILKKGKSVPDIKIEVNNKTDIYIEAKKRKNSSIPKWFRNMYKYEGEKKNTLRVLCYVKPYSRNIKVFMSVRTYRKIITLFKGKPGSHSYSIYKTDFMSSIIELDYKSFKNIITSGVYNG